MRSVREFVAVVGCAISLVPGLGAAATKHIRESSVTLTPEFGRMQEGPLFVIQDGAPPPPLAAPATVSLRIVKPRVLSVALHEGFGIATLRNPLPEAPVPGEHENPPPASLGEKDCATCASKSVTIYFGLGATALSPSQAKALADWLAQVPKNNDSTSFRAEVDAYTCDIGTDEANRRVAKERADAVAQWLTTHGVTVTARRTHAKADYAATEPALRALNRRVTVRLVSEQTKTAKSAQGV